MLVDLDIIQKPSKQNSLLCIGAKNVSLDYSTDESSTEGSGSPLLTPNERSNIRRGAQYHYQ